MTVPRQKTTGGLPRPRAGWICMAWFVLGISAVLAAMVPLAHDLRRQAELEMLAWLMAEGEALRPLVEQAERGRLGGAMQVPIRPAAVTSGLAAPSRYAHQAQLWLVSSTEGEPGLIVPVSADVVAPESLRDFSRLQEGIAAARGGVARPLAFSAGPDGLQAVAYLRLVGTGYGISTSMKADVLYAQVPRRLAAVAAVAATLLACACAGLFRLIAVPAGPAAAAVPAGPGLPPVPAGAAPATATGQRLEADLQRILYHADTLEHESKADPRLREHLEEIRATARQGLADLSPRRD